MMQNNPFRQKTEFRRKDKQFGASRNKDDSRNRLKKKEKAWGVQKFTPVVRTQPATPWSTFKDELIQKQQQEANLLKNPNMKSEEAKQFLKKREENFRRAQITEARKEDTKWEDFREDAHAKSSHKRKDREPNKESQTINISTKSKITIPVVNETLLSNFDSKKLTSQQNNTIRKMITKTTYLARGAPIESVVNDLKRRGLKPKKKNNFMC